MNSRSPEARKYHKLYTTKRWLSLRDDQLTKHPICQCPHCRERGLIADVVHHIKAHKGDRRLFFDRRNLASYNGECHDRFEQSRERGGHGFLVGCDARGWPLCEEHEWYDGERSASRPP